MSRPNVLLIISDHLSPRVMGAYGALPSATPAMDALAQRGVVLDTVYTPCPPCQPALAALWTGVHCHQTQVRSNGRKHLNGPLPSHLVTMGETFSREGYQWTHIGKRHDFGTLAGFDCMPEETEMDSIPASHPAWPEAYDSRRDNVARTRVLDFLKNAPKQPFFLVADIHNPHDICNWLSANDSLQGPVTNVPIPVPLPPLPENFDVDDWDRRPLPVRYLCCSHNRMAQASGWTEENYRYYIAAYRHYVAKADVLVGDMLEALARSGLADETLVVLTADHGDGQACHRMVTKQVSFYDETARVPWIAAGPGIPATGAHRSGLASLLDLYPTLCAYAGIERPDTPLIGRNIMPLLSDGIAPERTYVASEWHTEWGFTTSPGRMIRTERFKYVRYLEGNGEELYDLHADPGEKRTLIDDPAYAGICEDHRALLRAHIAETEDDFESLTVDVHPDWRSHQPGYAYHRGPAAPMLG